MDEGPTKKGIGKIAEDHIVHNLKMENNSVVRVEFLIRESGGPWNGAILNRVRGLLVHEEIDPKIIKNVIRTMMDNKIGFPDLLCVNKETKEIFFVEVKANTSLLTKKQKETVKILNESGFRVDVRYVDVVCSVSEREKISIKE